ncbi:MAG: ZIP family metal transporter [Candidatus Neomarinimicrobiota bacterium]|nr:MAG: ZIP family metal transporter [Candidatus Neomarinimicrobiota bacterium]
MILTYILIFSILGSIGSILLAALFLVFPDRIQKTLLPVVLSYATGTLLGSAFFGLIPELLHHQTATRMSALVLSGIVFFFVLEKMVIWRHCHTEDCEEHQTSGPLILIGDAFHNLIDGVVITVAFLSSIPLGIAVAISVAMHEIPQEVGDFAILLRSGYSSTKAFGLNLFSGLTALVGAVGSYYFMTAAQQVIPLAMGLAAGSFIYISLADLIPDLHRTTRALHSLGQFLLLLGGIGTIYAFHLKP